jgi:hypothetical protein
MLEEPYSTDHGFSAGMELSKALEPDYRHLERAYGVSVEQLHFVESVDWIIYLFSSGWPVH